MPYPLSLWFPFWGWKRCLCLKCLVNVFMNYWRCNTCVLLLNPSWVISIVDVVLDACIVWLLIECVFWIALHGCVFNWSGWRGRGPSQLCCDSPSMAAWSIWVVGVGAVRPILFDDWLWLLYGTWCVLTVWLWRCLFYLFYLSQQFIIYTMSYCAWLVSNLWHLTNFMLTYFSIVFRYFRWF